jgi:hypothetical protein
VTLNSDSHLVPETLRCIQRLLRAQSVCSGPALVGEAGAHHEPSLFQSSEDFPQCSLSHPLPSAVSLEPDPTASSPSLPASLLAVPCNARITADRNADMKISVWHVEPLSPSGRERQPVGRPAIPEAGDPPLTSSRNFGSSASRPQSDAEVRFTQSIAEPSHPSPSLAPTHTLSGLLPTTFTLAEQGTDILRSSAGRSDPSSMRCDLLLPHEVPLSLESPITFLHQGASAHEGAQPSA